MYVSIAWDPGTEDPHTLYGEPTLPLALYPGGSMGHTPPPLCPQTLPPVPGPWGPCLHAQVNTQSHAGLPPVHLLRGPPRERALQTGRQGAAWLEPGPAGWVCTCGSLVSCGPQCQTEDEGWARVCTLPPVPRCWGQTWGMCARMCTRVDVHTEAWISVCTPMSEYAHACVYVGMCMCTHVHVRNTK